MLKFIYLRSFLAFSFSSIFLVLSWHLFPTSELWSKWDKEFFFFLNHSMIDSPNLQHFWAVFNSRIGDWIGHLLFIGLCLSYLLRVDGEKRRRFVYRLIGFLIFIALLQFVFNKTVLPRLFAIERMSPSNVLGLEVDLSQLFSYPNNKAFSIRSFPADHATTLCLFTLFIWIYTGWKRGISMLLPALLLMFPRMVAGAHWLTDTVIGAGAISLASSALLFCIDWSGFNKALRSRLQLQSR